MSAKTTQVKDKGKRTKKLDDEKEKELMDYLKKHFFLDKFKESVKEMIDMDPNLPKDPVKYDKALRKRRDKLIEDFVKSEFQFFFNVAEYAKVLIDSWRGTFGNCLCGGGTNEPPIPEFLVRETRPDTPRRSQEDEDDAKEEEEEDNQEEDVEDELALDLEGDELEEELGEVDEDEVEGVSVEGVSEEVVQEEGAPEEELEEEEDDKEEELPESDDDPCTCIQGYMFPFPPEEYNYPLNKDGKSTKY
uniref:Uncharacterized protein n=1 Tax=Lygus hesperus TaxID=30085 RepID=A0A0A9WAT9_LYGHE